METTIRFRLTFVLGIATTLAGCSFWRSERTGERDSPQIAVEPGVSSAAVALPMDPPLAPHVVVNEVYVSATGATDQFVELYNPTDTIVSLSRLPLASAHGASVVMFSVGTLLAPGRHLVIAVQPEASSTFGTTFGFTPDFYWGNDLTRLDDVVTLGSPSATSPSVLTEARDIVVWGNAVLGFTYSGSRLPPPTDGCTFQRVIEGSEDFELDGPDADATPENDEQLTASFSTSVASCVAPTPHRNDDKDGSGFTLVNPASATAGTLATFDFDYTASASFAGGEFNLAIPLRWIPPTLTVGNGFVEVTHTGTTVISGTSIVTDPVTGQSVIRVNLSSMSPGDTIRIRYNWGGPLSTAPNGLAVFMVASCLGPAGCKPVPLIRNPVVDVTSPVLCGNGSLDGSESCDDGNLLAGDGCAADCTIEAGYCCIAAGRSCVAQGANPDNACQVCDPSATNQAWTYLGDGAACSTGSLCTYPGTCSSASSEHCEVTAKIDGTECASRCQGLSRYYRTCQGGACEATETWQSCDDGNLCTTDSCTAGACGLHSPEPPGTLCAPPGCFDPTTLRSYACDSAAACLPTNTSCDDTNECTVDACSGGACTHDSATQEGKACGAAPSCSGLYFITHACASGTCTETAENCDDANACTPDHCDAVLGCQSSTSCDDGVACTTGDTCSGTACIGNLSACPAADHLELSPDSSTTAVAGAKIKLWVYAVSAEGTRTVAALEFCLGVVTSAGGNATLIRLDGGAFSGGCGTTNASNGSALFGVIDTKAEDATLTLTDTTSSTALAVQTVTFIAADAAKLRLTPPPEPTGVCGTADVLVELLDKYDNRVFQGPNTSPIAIHLTVESGESTPSVVATNLHNATGVPGAAVDGSITYQMAGWAYATVSLVPAAAGTLTLSASYAEVVDSTKSVAITFEPGHIDPASSWVGSSRPALVVGVETVEATINLRDDCGEPIASTSPPTLATTRGSLSALRSTSTGTYAATLSAALEDCPGTAHISATVDGKALPSGASVDIQCPAAASVPKGCAATPAGPLAALCIGLWWVRGKRRR